MSWQVRPEWRAALAAAPRPECAGLPPRLAAVAHSVPTDARVADVGADHGLLGAALLAEGRARHVWAIDASEAALQGARRALAEAQAAGRATVLHGDGLDALAPGEVDCVVLAGLGAYTTLAILERAFIGGHRPARIVVQALSGEVNVRRALLQRGYGLADERLVADGRRLFLTLTFDAEGGVRALADDEEAYVGPHLTRRGGTLLAAWLEVQFAWLSRKVERLGAQDDPHADVARARLAAIERGRARTSLARPPCSPPSPVG